MRPALGRRPVTMTSIVAVRDGTTLDRADEVVTEEPMEVRLAGPGQDPVSVAVTMRTPGHDFELAVGMLHSEGLVRRGGIRSVRYCLPADERGEQRWNIVTVRIDRAVDGVPSRTLPMNASCGLCGKTSLDDLGRRCPTVPAGPAVAASVLTGLPEQLRAAQRVFATTGGLHAAGLFDATGQTVVVREDVGRHNAVDKVVGWAVLGERAPLEDHVLMVSGRVSFEIVEKAAMAGIGLIAAVSAPSSLAVDGAQRFGVGLVAFVRGDRFNVYAGPERIAAGS
jgi:FdhD protein